MVHANVMIKNESLLLPEVYKFWKDYPIDHWVFYNDNSTDNTEEIIKDLFGDKATVLNDNRTSFSESHNRSRMLEHSRDAGAKFVVSIDTDELLAANMLDQWDEVLKGNEKCDILYYWFNVVGDTVGKFRQDPLYLRNFRTFILPLSHTGKFDLSQYKYHTPRTPHVTLPKITVGATGFIHLQAINRRFYALKQLWYKHFEHITWGHSVEDINNKYDPVVNGLKFDEIDTPTSIIKNIEFDSSIYDEIESHMGYRDYIVDNLVPELVTFGKEYVN